MARSLGLNLLGGLLLRGFLERLAFYKLGDFIIFFLSNAAQDVAILLLQLLRELLQVGQVVGAELIDDAGQNVLQLLRLRGPTHHPCVRRNGGLHCT